MKIPILLALVLTLTVILSGKEEPLAVVSSEESMRIEIDGALQDWPADGRVERLPAGGTETSAGATLRLAADPFKFRLGILVADPEVHFRAQPFNEHWRNDSVELYFTTSESEAAYAEPEMRSGLIRISATEKGATVVEGSLSLQQRGRQTRPTGYPRLWESLGVRAALLQVPGGYSVEVEIPREILKWNGAQKGFRMNVRVCDNMGGEPGRRIVQLADDKYDTSFVSDEFYRQIRIVAKSVSPAGRQRNVQALQIYGALMAIDKHEPEAAVASLSEYTREPQFWPMLASMQIAAGRAGDGVRTLEQILASGAPDHMRLWAIQHIGTAHMRMQLPEKAKEYYKMLASSDSDAFRDAGTEALMQAAIGSGDNDSAQAAYDSYWKLGEVGNGKTLQAGSEWFLHKRQFDQADEALSRIAGSTTVHLEERSSALMRLQAVHLASGDRERAWAVGMRLQSTASPVSAVAAAALAELFGIAQARKETHPDEPVLSAQLFSALQEKMAAMGPARLMALAKVLREEKQLPEAEAIYSRVGSGTEFTTPWRAKGMAGLQRAQHEQGNFPASAGTGIRLQSEFPQETAILAESALLLRETCSSAGVDLELKRRCRVAVARLVTELKRRVSDEAGPEHTRARLLLEQFTR